MSTVTDTRLCHTLALAAANVCLTSHRLFFNNILCLQSLFQYIQHLSTHIDDEIRHTINTHGVRERRWGGEEWM